MTARDAATTEDAMTIDEFVAQAKAHLAANGYVEQPGVDWMTEYLKDFDVTITARRPREGEKEESQ